MIKIKKNLKLLVMVLVVFFGVNLSANAGWNYDGTGEVIYTVSSNTPPSVDPGPNKNLTVPTSSVDVTGTATDSDGTVVEALWSVVSGPVLATIGSQDTSLPTKTVTVSGMTVPGSYIFRYSARDDDNAWSYADMEVLVVDPTAPSGSISASNCTIVTGASVCNSTVAWSTANLTANPTEVTHNNPSSTSVSSATSGNQSVSVNHGVTSFYLYHAGTELAQASMTASCEAGSNWNGTLCQAGLPGTPSVNLTAFPTVVYSGNASTLSWVGQNVDSCTASAVPANGFWTGSKLTSSVIPHSPTGPLSATTTFTISCTGANGPASDSAVVTVVPNKGPDEIVIELTANPTKINSGDSSTLTWYCSPNATSFSGINFTPGALTGTESVSPTQNTNYTLRCSNATSEVSKTVSVNLKRRFLFFEF